MDKLVAQYSRPQHQNEFYSEQEHQDLAGSLPPLSLKFSLPPVDNVSVLDTNDKIYPPGQDGNAMRKPLRPDIPAQRRTELPAPQSTRQIRTQLINLFFCGI